MAAKRELLLRKHLATLDGDVVAEIYVRPDKPFRPIATGRRRIPVGQLSTIKAGMTPQEWESMSCELPMLEMCEVASPVQSLRAQPHGLYMKIVGRRRRLLYIPDLELRVEREFAAAVSTGTPFATAVKTWRPGKGRPLSTLVVEVKDDNDPRNHDVEYQDKLRLARQCYQGMGRFFATVVRSRDLDAAGIGRAVHEIFLDHSAQVTAQDIGVVSDAFLVNGERREEITLGRVQHVLGGGPVGTAKASAMHVRRIIGIDLSQNLAAHSAVRLIDDDRAIFERRGAR